MVLVKNWQLFILGEIGQENVFHDTLESRKIWVFPKGLVHRFGRIVSFFSSFHLSQNRPGKYFSRYSRKKKRLSRLKKEVVEKVEKLRCFHDILKRKRRFFRHL